ncbi:MAG: phage holin family protein [Chitinophagales bacterium]
MKDFILKLFVNAIGVAIASYLLPGVHVANFGYAVLIALTLSLLNASVKPMLVLLTLPATIFTLGLFLLFINAAIIMIADWMIRDGFQVDGWWWALFFSILLSALNGILERFTKTRPNRIPESDNGMKIYDKDGNRIA